MNGISVSCAAPHMTLNWHDIQWPNVQRNVRKLQIRIVKAIQVGKYGKAKALQWLLTHSFSGKALAVRRVTENKGKRTPGVDGQIWSTPRNKVKALSKLTRRGYQPQPLRRVYIPKRNGKKRPLDIPVMKDRAMQALYKLALDPIAETLADGNSYGFRLHRSAQDAIARCFITFAKRAAVQWVLEGDIKSCFNQISHDWLRRHIPMDKTLLSKWLKAGYLEKGQLFPITAGTPQGGIISPTLANMALDGLEKELTARFGYSDSARRNLKVKFVRYADDFIVTGISKELLENEVKPVIQDFLKERGLVLSQEKTRITHINKGFDFLGVNIRKYKGKLLIKPSQTSIQTFLKKVRMLVKANKMLAQYKLILLLNPIIRGWVNYHKPWVSSKVFNKVDHEIFKVLWQWSKRRHQKKRLRWIRLKYFNGSSNLTWSFAYGSLLLFRASGVKIQRYTKIKSEANPYCPRWEIYFEQKMSQRIRQNVSWGLKLKNLWMSQKGKCLQCGHVIDSDRGWHIHHLIPKVEGGRNTISNLVLLHPNCHKQVHHLDLKLNKPPRKGFAKA